MRQAAQENLSLKIFSLLLAIFLWAYVRYSQTSPTAEVQSMSEVYVTADLKLQNVGSDLVVVTAPKNVLITVRGPTDFIKGMGSGAVYATVDLRDKPAGVYNLAVTPQYPRELTLVQTDPERVNIELDVTAQRQVGVDLQQVGHPASGFTVGLPSIQPAAVTVDGPRTRVREVAKVVALMDVNGLETDVVQRTGVEALDNAGNLLPDVTVEPKNVVVSIPVRADVTARTVAVVPTLQGELPAGFEVDAAQVDPPLVTFMVPRGTPHPPLFMRTEPIFLKGIKHTVTVTSALEVPADVSVLRDKVVRVTLRVRKRKP
ncbi:MAG TPA: CdaR family protein [Candidatus Xenobia bacterium]|jgi:YbbR domain-containing protein